MPNSRNQGLRVRILECPTRSLNGVLKDVVAAVLERNVLDDGPVERSGVGAVGAGGEDPVAIRAETELDQPVVVVKGRPRPLTGCRMRSLAVSVAITLTVAANSTRSFLPSPFTSPLSRTSELSEPMLLSHTVPGCIPLPVDRAT